MRVALSTVLEQTAIPLELQEGRFGIRTAAIGGRQWIENGKFILAVSASMSGEQLRRNFPQQVKIGVFWRWRWFWRGGAREWARIIR